MRKKRLTQKEMLFCRLYAKSRNAREAAARSGFCQHPEKQGEALLLKKDIRDEIEKIISKRQDILDEVCAGLSKIAFGAVCDPIRLMIFLNGSSDEPIGLDELDKMDFSMISEIKMVKSGGTEIKFYDRIRAIEKLYEISENKSTEQAAPLYKAIYEGVGAINGRLSED